jgi:hypothetical protein
MCVCVCVCVCTCMCRCPCKHMGVCGCALCSRTCSCQMRACACCYCHVLMINTGIPASFMAGRRMLRSRPNPGDSHLHAPDQVKGEELGTRALLVDGEQQLGGNVIGLVTAERIPQGLIVGDCRVRCTYDREKRHSSDRQHGAQAARLCRPERDTHRRHDAWENTRYSNESVGGRQYVNASVSKRTPPSLSTNSHFARDQSDARPAPLRHRK